MALQATNRVSPQGDVWNDDSQRFPEKGLGNQSFVSHRKCVTRPACMVPRSLMASGVGRRPCHGYLPHSAGGYGLKGRVTPVLVEIGLSFQFLLRKTGDAVAQRSNPKLSPPTPVLYFCVLATFFMPPLVTMSILGTPGRFPPLGQGDGNWNLAIVGRARGLRPSGFRQISQGRDKTPPAYLFPSRNCLYFSQLISPRDRLWGGILSLPGILKPELHRFCGSSLKALNLFFRWLKPILWPLMATGPRGEVKAV